MGFFSELWFLDRLMDNIAMDPDLGSLMRTANVVRQTVLKQMHFGFKSAAGKLTCSQAGIAGLYNLYEVSQLETCLQRLGPSCARLGHGRVTLRSEAGFAAYLQSMNCTYFPYSSAGLSKVPYCNMNMKKCGCRMSTLHGDYIHLPGCLVPESLNGVRLSLDTLSRLMTRLQGEVIIDSPTTFEMWHHVVDALDDSIVFVDGVADDNRKHEGPAVYHTFHFDAAAVRKLFNDLAAEEPVRSEPAFVYHATHGDCRLYVDLVVFDEGFLFETILVPAATGEEISLVGRYRPGGSNSDTGIYPMCEILLFSPLEASFYYLNQDTYFYTDDTGAQCDQCWLPRAVDVYPTIKDTLCSGRPLTMLVSIVD